MQPIAVRYRAKIAHVLLITLIVFGLSAAVIVATHRQLLHAEPSDRIWTTYMFLALAIGICVAALLTLRDRERMNWSLSEQELVGGFKYPVRIPITSIVSISEGVPARTKFGANNPWLKSGIVLKTKDNWILSLNLATNEEGAQMMEALMRRCSAVFTTEPSFTASELSILHRLKWNRVIDITSGKPV
jgi:hypothetical protein